MVVAALRRAQQRMQLLGVAAGVPRVEAAGPVPGYPDNHRPPVAAPSDQRRRGDAVADIPHAPLGVTPAPFRVAYLPLPVSRHGTSHSVGCLTGGEETSTC